MRKPFLAPVIMILTLAASIAGAQAACTIPNTFMNTQPADASQVMGNFTSLAACAAPLASPTFTGNVGIGTTTPLKELSISIANSSTSVADGTSDIMRLTNTTGGAGKASVISLQTYSAGALARIGAVDAGSYGTELVFHTHASDGIETEATTEKMRITAAGSVGIGTATPGYTLHVNGSVAGTSAYNNLSDERLKKNIVPLMGGLELISQLQPVRFDWRAANEREVGKDLNLSADRQVGFIAQAVGKVLPEAVSTANDKDAIMSVAESKVVPLLVAAVKELKAANDNQSIEIGRLGAQIVALERKVRMQTAQR